MAIEEPRGTGTTSENFVDFLIYFRTEVVQKLSRLPESELRRSRLPSGWTPIELLCHLIHMEQRWFVWGFLGEELESPWGDWNVEDPGADAADGVEPSWHVPATTTLTDLTDALTAVGQRTTEILDAHSLSESGRPGPRWSWEEWPLGPGDLRWICFHVLQEYARHTGHLDIAVELST